MSAVFQELSAIFQTNTLNAVGEPEVDLVDTEQSCVPDPSVTEPEPAGPSGEEANDQGGLDAEENCSTGEDIPYSCVFMVIRDVSDSVLLCWLDKDIILFNA